MTFCMLSEIPTNAQRKEHASALVSLMKESNYFESKSIANNRIDANLTIKQYTVFRYFFVCCLAHRGSTVVFFASVFQSCCSTPQGSPGVGRNTFLSSPHLCFIIVFMCDLFVSCDDPLMS